MWEIKDSFVRAGVAVVVLVSFQVAQAQEVAEIPQFNAPPGTAALGGGIRGGQSPYFEFDNDDQKRLDLIPLYLYNGKHVFFRGVSGGVHLYNNNDLEVSVLGRYRFQHLDPGRNEFYEGIEERRQSLDAGFQTRLSKDWGTLRLSWVTDTLDRHKGQEVQLSYRYHFDAGPFSFSPFISWSWQDENLTNYYFGVSPEEARPDLPEYTPGDSQRVSFGLNSAWQVTDRITFFGNVAFGGASSEVLNSPLVDEDNFSQAFVGGISP